MMTGADVRVLVEQLGHVVKWASDWGATGPAQTVREARDALDNMAAQIVVLESENMKLRAKPALRVSDTQLRQLRSYHAVDALGACHIDEATDEPATDGEMSASEKHEAEGCMRYVMARQNQKGE